MCSEYVLIKTDEREYNSGQLSIESCSYFCEREKLKIDNCRRYGCCCCCCETDKQKYTGDDVRENFFINNHNLLSLTEKLLRLSIPNKLPC